MFRRRGGARLAVKILRGHEDLLQIFQRKFAPQADLRSTKREIKDPDVGVSGVGFFSGEYIMIYIYELYIYMNFSMTHDEVE